MNTLSEIIFLVSCGWLVALIFIGPFQVIAALIRAYQMKDWKSDFGRRLKKYFWMLLVYWIMAGICIFLDRPSFNSEWTFFIFVPTLCTALAIYYWRAIYLLSKSKKTES